MTRTTTTMAEPGEKGVMDRVVNHPFFSGMSRKERAVVATSVESNTASEAVCEQDEIIFREGEPANRFYLIESGAVMLEFQEPNSGTYPLQQLGPGDALGFSWLFPPFAWCLQARAIEKTSLIILDGAHLLVAAEEDKAFGYDLMKKVGQIAIQRLQASRKQHVKVSQELQTARQSLKAKSG